jgi:hypothetical protein
MGGFSFANAADAQRLMQQAVAAQQASTPGKSAKKQKIGPTGVAVSPSGTLSQAQFAQFSQSLGGNGFPGGPIGQYLTNGYFGAAGMGPPDSTPRGRWSEEMTNKLIELRTNMDPQFRSIARPDKLWEKITNDIAQEFGAALQKQSTKDKCEYSEYTQQSRSRSHLASVLTSHFSWVSNAPA